ncbi:hypothetical protein [Neptunicella sp.]|uniref:hypothetical protein n=1 Tax=Neptunicella sp. TaxID=2125986 RepID=UPI003F693277
MKKVKFGKFVVEADLEFYERSGVTKCVGHIVPEQRDEIKLSEELGEYPYKEYIGPALIDGKNVTIKTTLHLSGRVDNYFTTNIEPFDKGYCGVEIISDLEN